MAWRTLFDPGISDKVGQAFRNPSFWQRDGGAQSAVFGWSPFSMYFGHMGDGKSRHVEAVVLKAASPRVQQLLLETDRRASDL